MRNVLTAAGNRYDFDAIRGALELQFPGVPPAHFRQNGQRKDGGKGGGKDGKGGKGGKSPKQVYAAAVADAKQVYAAAVADTPEEIPLPDGGEVPEQEWQGEPEEHGEPGAEDRPVEEGATTIEDADLAMFEAAEVLSVTANRLKAITQGRGWKGAYGKGGQKGQSSSAHFTSHGKGGKGGKSWGAWGQRPQFPSGSSGYRPNYTASYTKGKGQSSSSTAFPSQPHQVQQTEWTGEEISDDWWNIYMQEENAPSHHAYVVTTQGGIQSSPEYQIGWQVDAVANEAAQFSALAVLDTACQRSVAGM
eukprot:6488393-Amphidinium_carterae.1